MKGTDLFFYGYNLAQSSSVRIVTTKTVINISDEHIKIPVKSVPNSVVIIRKNNITTCERYFGNDGFPYLDIDYTNHGNSATHPITPHEHIWIRTKDGKLIRDKWRKIR